MALSDLFNSLKTTVVNAATSSVTQLEESAANKVDTLFKDVTTSAAAKIEGSKVSTPVNIPAAQPSVPSAPLPPVEASGAAKLPSYAGPVAIVFFIGLVLFLRGK